MNMELTYYIFVLCVINIVTASPYGYGPKGGAAAKAEASAVASAYAGAGGVPINIPSGGGYSGSYSKASSSSYASSSASASSSAFSYSGSNPGAYPGGASTIPGSSGCGTGTCQSGNKGSYGTSPGSQATSGSNSGLSTGIESNGAGGKGYNSGNINAGTQNYGTKSADCGSGSCQPNGEPSSSQFSGANNNAIAAASANAGISGQYSKGSPSTPQQSTGCSGSICGTNNNYQQGSSSSYNQNDIAKPDANCVAGKCDGPLAHDNENDCKNGKCGTSDNDSDDIQIPKNDQPVLGNSCSNGNCGPSSYGSKPSYTQTTPGQSEPEKCSTPYCNNYDNNPSISPQGSPSLPGNYKPATFLTTPKEEHDGCYPPNCQNGMPINNVNYNAPAPSAGKPPSCVGGYCGYSTPTKTSMTPDSYNYASLPQNVDGNKCTSPNCVNTNPQVEPVNSNIPTNCGADGKCSSSQAGYGRPTGTNINHAYEPSQYQRPGNCAPGVPGCDLKPHAPGVGPSPHSALPSAFGSTVPASPPYHRPTPTSNVHPSGSGFGSNYVGNALSSSQVNSVYGSTPSNNAASFPSTQYSPSGYLQPSTATKPGYAGYAGTYNSRPSGLPSNSFPPVSSSGYNSRPSGYGSQSTAVPSVPSSSSHNLGNSPISHNSPTYSSGVTSPAFNLPSSNNCNTPGCSSPALSSSADITPSKDLPKYSGGFGAPPGILKPNDFSLSQATIPKSPSSAETAKPPCVTGSCGQEGSFASPSYGHGGPNTGAHATAGASASSGVYTGGFGGPPGFLKPYDNGIVDLPTGKSPNTQSGLHQGTTSAGNNGYGGANTNQANSAAVANAASSALGGSGTANNFEQNKPSGCSGGCGGYGGSNGGNHNLNGSYSHSGSGASSGLNSGLNVANAKSQANAVSGAGGYGSSGSYASSSASAHASSGAAVKGSYGKR